MRIARKTMLLISICCCVWYWSEQSQMAQSGDRKAGAQETLDASKLFNDNCTRCHGKDGRAKTFHGRMVGARNLTDAKWQGSVTDDRIVAAIKKGPGAMPSFEKKFTQEQIASLVPYVRQLKRDEATMDKK
jgi:mono/diheme cytochrome c family protein